MFKLSLMWARLRAGHWPSKRRFFRKVAQQMQLSENSILLGMAVVVGLGTGLGVWAFREGMAISQEVFREGPIVKELGKWGIVPALGLVGLIVGSIMQKTVGEERYHGVTSIIESVSIGRGKLPYEKIPFKSVAAAMSIGGGASVGPEDPSVQIGCNLGSFLGFQLHLSEERIKLLVAAGGASAVAAAFNAPIAGVFFALEVILGNFGTGSVGVVVLASVMSSVLTQSLGHVEPELGIRNYELGGPTQIPFYIALGLITAPLSAGFIRMVYWQRRLWHGWEVPRPLKTALTGMIVGVVAVFYPQIMGAGRETMNEVLNTGGGDSGIMLLISLVFIKISMTSLSMGGGFVGGIFAPSLFTGAMLGGAFGRLAEAAFPTANIGDPAAYAIAGMAAMMAGIVRAPITAILLIFELTNNYQLILPIMLATVVTVFLTERFEKDGIYIKALRQAGIHIQEGRDVDVMQSVLVREVMQTPAPVISPKATLTEVRDAFRRYKTKGLCVIEDRNDKQRVIGIVTMADLQTAYETASQATVKVNLLAEDICSRDLTTITPDEPVFVAIRRMTRHDFGHLPVVAPDNDQALLGLLAREDVMRSYTIAITRKYEDQYAKTQIRLQNLVNQEVIALTIPNNAQVVGKRILEVKWPKDCVVVSIRRRDEMLIPHGETVIEGGDEMTVVATPECSGRIKGIVAAPSLKTLGLEE